MYTGVRPCLLQKTEFKELSVNSPATTNQVKKQHLPPPPAPREHSRLPPRNGNSPVYGTLCFSLYSCIKCASINILVSFCLVHMSLSIFWWLPLHPFPLHILPPPQRNDATSSVHRMRKFVLYVLLPLMLTQVIYLTWSLLCSFTVMLLSPPL